MLLTRGGSGIQFVQALNPAAWYRYGIGITVTGAGVSTWADQSGNGRDLLQATDAARPALQADGSILFDGVDNNLKCSTFTFNQPESCYLLFRSVSFTSQARIFDGNTTNTGGFLQGNDQPGLDIYAGSTVSDAAGLAVGVYGVVCVVFNGANSVLRVNNTISTGNAGASNMAGFTLGDAGGFSLPSNIQAKEVILYSGAHTETQQGQIINYLFRLI